MTKDMMSSAEDASNDHREKEMNDMNSEQDMKNEPSTRGGPDGDNRPKTQNSPDTERLPDGSDSESKADAQTEPAKEEEENWVFVLGHDRLKKKTLREGDGFSSRPQHGQIITISYSTKLADGKEVDENKSQTFTLGDGDVMQALDLCCALMELHELCEIIADAQYAYGAKGRENDIPGNAQLTITVELLVTEEAPMYSTWPICQRVKEAQVKRERGNELYYREEYSPAINSYTKALTILDDRDEAHKGSAEDLQLLLDTRMKCYNNLAAAQIKVEAWDAAVKSCDEVLKQQPENIKALFRKGKCLGSKGSLEKAIAILEKANQIEKTKIVQQELQRLKTKSKKQNSSQRDMYKRMFWGDNEKAAAEKQKKEKSQRWFYVGGAMTVALISISIAYQLLH